MKLLSIVGTRPQFVKLAPVNALCREFNNRHIVVHTGQHYDYNMSVQFFKEFGIKLDYDLGIGGISDCKQIGYTLAELENILYRERPSWVLVYGDTNSTLAGALSAVKCRIPLAHIEAGLRSHTRMQEEYNRKVTDHLSDLLFCPTWKAVENLKSEGIQKNIFNVGDLMYDAVLQYVPDDLDILRKLGIRTREYVLATVHRAENTNQQYIRNIMIALSQIKKTVIFPCHPRTAKYLNGSFANVRVIPPVSYSEMLNLEKHSDYIVTDSGGVQKEAFFFSRPCVLLRNESEWTEIVESGNAILAGVIPEKIVESCRNAEFHPVEEKIFGDGNAARKIMETLNGSHN